MAHADKSTVRIRSELMRKDQRTLATGSMRTKLFVRMRQRIYRQRSILRTTGEAWIVDRQRAIG